jgi:hypothetical protein
MFCVFRYSTTVLTIQYILSVVPMLICAAGYATVEYILIDLGK